MKSLPKSRAKDVFSYLLAIVTLYVGVVSFIALFFQYTNVGFPDPLQFSYTNALDVIRQSMAALIVVWPVFILISWFINKDIKSDPEKHEISIRKWLLYLTLFVTAITIIVDLVTLVNYFLQGEITTRFILKVIVVLITAAAVFAYYLWDLRHEVNTKSPAAKIVAVISCIVVVASIILGFVFVGSPAKQRQVRFDDQRIQELSMIQNEIINYYQLKQTLPLTLNELNNSISGFVAPVDPVTHEAYTYFSSNDPTATIYSKTGNPVFDLCANFITDSTENTGLNSRAQQAYPVYPGASTNTNWNHAVGTICFERTIDPALYPPSTLIK